MELPLTHPELYEDIGIKPPKVCALRREQFRRQTFSQPPFQLGVRARDAAASRTTASAAALWIASESGTELVGEAAYARSL